MASGNGTSIDLLLKHQRDQIKIIFTNKINSNIKEKAFKNNIPFFCFERNNESKLVYYEKIINEQNQKIYTEKDNQPIFMDQHAVHAFNRISRFVYLK